MFIRTNTTPNSPRRSIQIVESVREGAKVKQRIVRYVGVAMDEYEEAKLRALAQEYIYKIEAERLNQASLFSTTSADIASLKRGRPRKKTLADVIDINDVKLSDLKEESRLIEGPDEILGDLYRYLGFNTIVKSKRDQQILQDLVIARIMNPSSKLRTQKLLAEHWGREHHVDAIYRMMDRLYDRLSYLKQSVFNATKSLTQGQVDVMLFDVTTLYFESQEADDLRKFGYSKDQKYHCTQVVLALATNEDGLPIGYELFPGNTAEVSTLLKCIETWQKDLSIGQVTFVADRAMCTRSNLAALEGSQTPYVVAMPMRRSLKKDQAKDILANQKATLLSVHDDLIWSQEYEFEGKRLIVTYSASRARKDQADRQAVLDQLSSKLKTPKNAKKLISNSGYLKYVQAQGEPGTFVFNDEKILDDAQWDGLHAIITNDFTSSAQTLLTRYRRLWVIEDSFRVHKHSLAARPMYHFKPERIQAHIALCYLAFALIRQAQQRIKLAQSAMSVEAIRDALMGVQASILKHEKTGDRYKMPSKFSQAASTIYKAFGKQRRLNPSVYLP